MKILLINFIFTKIVSKIQYRLQNSRTINIKIMSKEKLIAEIAEDEIKYVIYEQDEKSNTKFLKRRFQKTWV